MTNCFVRSRILFGALSLFTAVTVIACSPGLAKDGKKSPELATVQAYDERKRIEKLIGEWKPSEENQALPSSKIRCGAKDISGFWKRGGGYMEHVTIKLFSTGPNTYRVLFSDSESVDHWTLVRQGTYKEGILTLDKPVLEGNVFLNRPIIYKRLFTIQVKGKVCLISDIAFYWSQKIPEVMPGYKWEFGNVTRRVLPVQEEERIIPKPKPQPKNSP